MIAGVGVAVCSVVAFNLLRDEPSASAQRSASGPRRVTSAITLERITRAAGPSNGREGRLEIVIAQLESISKTPSRRDDFRHWLNLGNWVANATQEELIIALSSSQAIKADGDFIDELTLMVFGRFGEIDGETGLALLKALPAERTKLSRSKNELFNAWFQRDPQAAIHGAIGQLPDDGEDMNDIVSTMLTDLAKVHPDIAMARAAELARSERNETRALGFGVRADFMETRLSATKDYNAAAAWIETTKVSPEERHYLLERLAKNGIEKRDASGVLVAYRQLGGAAGEELTLQVFRALAKDVPDQAKLMAASMPAGELRRAAVGGVVEAIGRSTGIDAALGWLSSQGSHPDFDLSYEAIAEAHFLKNPQTAWRAVGMITESAENKVALSHRYAHEWLVADYASAARELPSQFVNNFLRVKALLGQLGEIYPEASVGIKFGRR